MDLRTKIIVEYKLDDIVTNIVNDNIESEQKIELSTPIKPLCSDLDFMGILMDVEEEFSAEISDDEAENLNTINDIVKWLMKNISEEELEEYGILNIDDEEEDDED